MKCQKCGAEVKGTLWLHYEEVEVDRCPDDKKAVWERWGTLHDLETLISAEVKRMLPKCKDEDARKLAKKMIIGNPDGVLSVLKQSDARIRGWRCVPSVLCERCSSLLEVTACEAKRCERTSTSTIPQ